MNTNNDPFQAALAIFNAATPVLRIHGLGGSRWKRNVPESDARRGPWLQARYEVINETAWRAKGACLYLVAGGNAKIRYVGISRNGVKHRWRTSPAYDILTGQRLPVDQLFHSQCWKHIEREAASAADANFEVRCIEANTLVTVLEQMGGPLRGFTVLRDDGESVVAGVERWLCNHKSLDLVSWNSAMTGKK
ncbi:hypothetical protein [Brevundimonas sp.]|uniref:hypothetical protein n=1 Tax=Brevundimonas sp. TaxID=1871086 RepID=UPI00273105BC|nr:hypothetical protein [Brevundimonas sp.]MDP1912319.1 hypothetical protein [Brevundimonas sp.]